MAEWIITDEFKALTIQEGVRIQIGDYRGEYDLLMQTDAYTARIGEKLHEIL